MLLISRWKKQTNWLTHKHHQNKTTSNKQYLNNKLTIGECEVEDVTEFCYLGSTHTKDGGDSFAIQRHIQKVRQPSGFLNIIWRSQYINIRTKLYIFNTNIKSILLYGWETWKITNKLQVTVNRYCSQGTAQLVVRPGQQ